MKRPAERNVFDILDAPAPTQLPGLIVLLGTDRFLKQQAIRHFESASDDDDSGFVRFANDCFWEDVIDELATVSLFGTGPRRVLINDADEFVSPNRGLLEKYALNPPLHATLALDLKSLPANQKLYRNTVQSGWVVRCTPPETQATKNAPIDTRRLFAWLNKSAQTRHQIQLDKPAIKLLVELIDWNFGQLDQELAKLALFVEADEPVSAKLVAQVVGGWRTETTWEMLEAAADGNVAEALKQLDHLLQSGESAFSLFGSTSWSFRRFGAAARFHAAARRDSRSPDLTSILRNAGFHNQLPRAERQLKQIGRHRADQLFRWLLELDLALKGSHSSPALSRWAMELLLLRLSQQADPRRGRE